MKGEIVEFSEAPISNIPFLSINWENVGEVALHERITRETSLYLEDKDENHQHLINELFNTLYYEKSAIIQRNT